MNRYFTTSVLAALLCGTAANADVTARQVWDNWTEQMALYGDGFTTGAQTMDGDTLTVTDVRIEVSDDSGSVVADFGDFALTENGDGTVSVSMPESYPITISDSSASEGPVKINVTVQQAGVDLTISGDPDALIYDFEVMAYSINIDSVEENGTPDPNFETAAVTLRDLSGQYSTRQDNLTRIAYDLAIGALDMDVSFVDPEEQAKIQFNADIADIAMFANIASPIDMDFEAEFPPFNEGLSFEGGYTFGKLLYDFDFASETGAGSAMVSVSSGELAAGIDMDTAVYAAGSQGIEISVFAPNEFDVPVAASIGRSGLDFIIPLSRGEDGPRDARMAFNLMDFTVDDALWNMLDPSANLPRSPITVALGLDMQVTPFFDLLDPDQQEALAMAQVPGELNGVQITDLTLRAAGAEITGEGAFSFDNSDLETFDGFPRPEGEATFAINGVNGLIDRLIEMGLIPQEDAMMPRMMMGMFTVPVGDDMLTSTIGVNPEGHVLANGQRLR